MRIIDTIQKVEKMPNGLSRATSKTTLIMPVLKNWGF